MLTIDSRQMAELDRIAVEEYHIDLAMMMENAGRALASQIRRFLKTSLGQNKILVMVGKGNNGGGGLVAARHLHNWGANVEVTLGDDMDNFREAAAKQMKIISSMDIKIHSSIQDFKINSFHLIIDALLGYNQKGNPRGKVAELVTLANSSGKPIIALDTPTGLDPDNGKPNTPCIKAAETLTLAIPKKGLLTTEARFYVGRLFLADISIPKELYRRFGVHNNLFQEDTIIEIRDMII